MENFCSVADPVEKMKGKVPAARKHLQTECLTKTHRPDCLKNCELDQKNVQLENGLVTNTGVSQMRSPRWQTSM